MKIRASAELGRFLRTKREESKLSQRQVAEMFNYASSQFVSNWERGKAAPPIETLKVLKNIYKMDANDVADVISRGIKEDVTKYLEH